ncbi:MAG: fasciclin domain-containing protein [Bacteroidetes bacterium]|nr:fasciclin domain-containing protein [Bacteroidota bacterium]
MKKPILIVAALLAISLFSNKVSAQAAAPAAGSGDVVATMATSDNYNVAGMLARVAGLSGTLDAAGPYTVFAPTNEAFGKLSATKADSLAKDPAKLATVLKYHVVSGKYTKADIIKALSASKDRKVELKTLDGQNVTLSVVGGKLQLADDHGNTALVTAFDLPASNGVVHGLDAVLDTK